MPEARDWIEEANKYSSLSEQEQGVYWSDLNSAEQLALKDALESQPDSDRRGCLKSPPVVGCLGIVVGIVLTIGTQFALLTMGVKAVSNTIGGITSSAPSDPASIDNVSDDQLVAYCGTKWEKKYKRIRGICNGFRANQAFEIQMHEQRKLRGEID